MNKADVVDAMAKYTSLSKAQSKEALEAFLDVIAEHLKKGQEIVLTGFGSFSVLKRKARTGVNPATGKKMQIPSKKVPKFKPGKALKDLVRK